MRTWRGGGVKRRGGEVEKVCEVRYEWRGGEVAGRDGARRSFPVDAQADGADGLRADGARHFALEPLERALVVAEERLELVEAVLVVVLRGARGAGSARGA